MLALAGDPGRGLLGLFAERPGSCFGGLNPGPLPPAPERFDAALDWLDGKLEDSTLETISFLGK